MKTVDVVIVGDGLVALSLALACLQRGWSVKLLTKQGLDKIEPLKGTYDVRVSALTPASIDFLRVLGVWDCVLNRRATPFRRMAIQDNPTQKSLHFDATNTSQEALGFIVENSVLRAALIDALLAFPGFNYDAGLVLEEALWVDKGWLVKAKGHSYWCKLLVGAEGAHSWVREQAHIQMSEKSYGQQAMVATLTTLVPHQETAYQQFYPESILACLPLSNPHKVSLVWSCDDGLANTVSQLDDTAFLAELNRHLPPPLQEILSVENRALFPLVARQAETYASPHLALVGDAAHTIHPLAGQGLNMGLGDVIELVQTLDEQVKRRRPLGEIGLLNRYHRRRRVENQQMAALMSFLKQLFASRHPWVRQLRGQGLGYLESCIGLKGCIMNFAMGSHLGQG